MKNKLVYLCGPTVYDKVHIGNMRPIVTFDLILRGLKLKDKNIKLIHNITDIDDKIINKARLEKKSEEEISQEYFQFYINMLSQYNVVTIDFMPKVSEKIEFIEKFIKELNEKNYVYEKGGSHYFKTSKLKYYGEVSNNSLDNLKSQNENNEKENSFDFVLWKNKSEGKKWEISLGNGRPGWHTECVSFIYELSKNEPLLIHGGGIDLKFPHHENENAQFRALTNKPITKEWLHVGIIKFDNQKMSKSIGNIIYADSFLEKYNLQTNASDLFRLIILSSSIKSNIELNDELIHSLIKKNNQIKKIINFYFLNKLNLEEKNYDLLEIIDLLASGRFSNIYKIINENVKEFNSKKNKESAIKIFEILTLLGFKIVETKIDDEIIKIYQKWQEEFRLKNFKKSDELRKILIDKDLI